MTSTERYYINNVSHLTMYHILIGVLSLMTLQASLCQPSQVRATKGWCSSSEFQCLDGTCIYVWDVCDGRRDCPNDSTDEDGCSRPKNLTITGPDSGGNIYLYEYLYCRAEGKPAPKYKWIKVELGSDYRSGQSIEMSSEGTNLTYICKATNEINGHNNEESISVTVNVKKRPGKDPSSSSSWAYYLLSLTGLIGLIPTCVLLLVHCKRKCQKPGQGTANADDCSNTHDTHDTMQILAHQTTPRRNAPRDLPPPYYAPPSAPNPPPYSPAFISPASTNPEFEEDF